METRNRTRGASLLLSVVVVAYVLVPAGPAAATSFTPSCTAASLANDVVTANTSTQDDVINLPAGCTYHMAGTIVVKPDNAPPPPKKITINGNGATIEGNGSSAVFSILPKATLILNDVTIEGGFSSSNGGGIQNQGTLELKQSAVIGSQAKYGGGIYNAGGTVTLIDSEVSQNSATTEGGGIYNVVGGSVWLKSNSTVSDNQVLISGGDGGGILNLGLLNVNASQISYNRAPAGGGILSYGQANLTNGASVTHNDANFGGGVYNGNGLSIANSAVSDNTAQIHGGGIYTLRQVTLLSSTLANNHAKTGAGGGAFIDGPVFGIQVARLTLTQSTVSHNRADLGDGGAVYNLQGHVTSKASTVSNNHAAKSGGGVFNTAGGTVLLLSGTNLKYNDAGATGGGVYNNNVLDIKNSTVSNNRAASGGGGAYSTGTTAKVFALQSAVSNNKTTQGNGGGIANLKGGSLQTQHSALSGNTAAGAGGAIANEAGKTSVAMTTLSGNNASAGGAIYNSSGKIDVNRSTLSMNMAATGGAIQNHGDATVDDSTLEANAATGSYPSGGGGIYTDSLSTPATLRVTYSTLSKNTSNGNGGGIASGEDIIVGEERSSSFGQVELTNVTFWKNTAVGYGGAISNRFDLSANNVTITQNTASANAGIDAGFGSVVVSNSIITGNPGGNCSANMAGSFNLSSVAGCGAGFSVGSPNLGSLAPNGGPTETVELLPGSDAIDTGDTLLKCAQFDQRGRARVDGPTDIDITIECDKGAFEFGGRTIGTCSGCRPVAAPVVRASFPRRKGQPNGPINRSEF